MQHGPVGSPSSSPSLASPAGSVSWVARARLVLLVVRWSRRPRRDWESDPGGRGDRTAAVSAVSSVGLQVRTPRKPRGSTQPSPLAPAVAWGRLGRKNSLCHITET